MTDRSDQSVSRTHQRPAGRWNNDNADDADDESFSPRKQRQFSENQVPVPAGRLETIGHNYSMRNLISAKVEKLTLNDFEGASRLWGQVKP